MIHNHNFLRKWIFFSSFLVLKNYFYLFFYFFNPYYRYRPKPNPKHHSSRSLDRLQHESDLESNKENSFKTRIQVISPDRQHNLVQNGYNRKPYKTTINTATDNILYRGNSSEHLQYYHYGENGSHYKVPRSGKPVMVNPYKRENGTSPYR